MTTTRAIASANIPRTKPAQNAGLILTSCPALMLRR
jgi:hypothetical protein